MKGDSDNAYGCASHTSFAERYGGHGLAGNGGGGRCGLIGQVDIKGIGPTPVLGKDTDYKYSHGTISVRDAIREVIWGEVCNAALPYGGARAYGLLDTGTLAPIDAFTGDATGARALVVRDATPRLAHFMRAADFNPTDTFAATNISDSGRTARALARLGRILSSTFGFPTGIGPATEINDGLVEMIRRLATQISTSRAKRMMHGTLTASNVLLNGGWVDYGTATTISDYGRIMPAANAPDLWFQHYTLRNEIAALSVYLRKYLPKHVAIALLPCDDLVAIMDDQVESSLARGYAYLTGMAHGHRGERTALEMGKWVYHYFERLVRAGNSEPFKLDEMPTKMGQYSLNDMMRHMSVCYSRESMDHAVARDISDVALRTAVCNLVWQVRERFLARIDSELRPFYRIYVMLNALRINTSVSQLYRPELNRQIDHVLKSNGDIGSLVNSVVGVGSSLLQDDGGDSINVGGMLSGRFREVSIFTRAQCSKDCVINIISCIAQSTLEDEYKELAGAYVEKSLSNR